MHKTDGRYIALRGSADRASGFVQPDVGSQATAAVGAIEIAGVAAWA
ncbi:MAG: hypothetical protein ACYDGY_09870 [Acidimicrobiales bacterium]